MGSLDKADVRGIRAARERRFAISAAVGVRLSPVFGSIALMRPLMAVAVVVGELRTGSVACALHANASAVNHIAVVLMFLIIESSFHGGLQCSDADLPHPAACDAVNLGERRVTARR
ncbi:MAG: hypothetical protein ABJA62_05480 [Luteimonas sp.]